MKRNWVLDADTGVGGTSCTLSLGVQDPDSGKLVYLIPPGKSPDAFQTELSSIKAELDHLLRQAQEKIRTLEQKNAKAPAPEEVWQKMEACASETEMFDYFNLFDEGQRQSIAEYIFTHVSMFKGRGVVFAEHYDAVSHVLA